MADFLALTPEKAAFVEIKLALSDALRAQRQKAQLSQAQVVKQLGSRQSRVAKMEAGDPSVTFDLLIRTLLALGATKKTVARTIISLEQLKVNKRASGRLKDLSDVANLP